MRKGKPLTIDLPLTAPPAGGKNDVRNLAGQHPFDGARVSNILPGLADELGLEDEGVVILSVRPGSIAARLGFQRGDVVISVGGQTITALPELDDAVKQHPRVWAVEVKRGGQVLQLRVPG